jgi:hypothetical protein
MLVFWVVTPCGLVSEKPYVSIFRAELNLYTDMCLRKGGINLQVYTTLQLRTNIDALTAVKTSGLP